MTVEYELTPEDIAAFARYHVAQSHAAAREERFLRYGISGGFLCFFLVRLAIGLTPGDYVWLAFAVLWFVLQPKFFRAGVRRNASTVAEQMVYRGTVGPHRLAVEPHGITDTTPAFSYTTYWSGIERVVKAPDQVLVYVGPNAAFQVPRRAFADDAALDAFVQALQARIAPAAA